MSTPNQPDVLWLDGMPDEAVVLPSGEPRRALGRDPFDEPEGPDAFESALRARSGAPAEARGPETPVPAPEPAALDAPEPDAPDVTESDALDAREDDLTRGRRRRGYCRTPRVDEVELTAPESLAERMLSEDVRRRLGALTHLVEGGAPYDRYGFSPAAAQTAFPFFLALYRHYFRVESRGHENIPTEGPAVLAANHGGLLPFDGAMTVVDTLLNSDPPRLPRAVVDRWAGALPFVNVFFARVGQVIGTRENVNDLLDDGQLLLVFPEGMSGVRKRITQRYRVQRFYKGFVEAALRADAPIVPMAIVGSDDQAPILYDFQGLAKALGLPSFPITPTFPWLGPAGLLPYPVRYEIVYGEPLAFHERFGPEGAEDPQLVRYLANQVRREVQRLLDRNRR